MSGGRNVNAAMVLCAGLGTRLRPLTDELAKPMVPVGDLPALAHVIARVRLAVATRVVVNVHHRPDDVRAYAAEERISVSEETELLGTAGGVERAASLLGEGSVLVWNGDILSDFDPRELVAVHESASTSATLVVKERPAGEGNVGLAEDGRIVRLRRESFAPESRGGDFLGIHAIGAPLRAALPSKGCLVGDVYLPALRRGEHLGTHTTSASFTDVGSITAYLAANAAWLATRSLAFWSHPTAIVNAPAFGSVIGAGAVVDAPALESVVWPNSHVQSACSRVVVTPLAIAS